MLFCTKKLPAQFASVTVCMCTCELNSSDFLQCLLFAPSCGVFLLLSHLFRGRDGQRELQSPPRLAVTSSSSPRWLGPHTLRPSDPGSFVTVPNGSDAYPALTGFSSPSCRAGLSFPFITSVIAVHLPGLPSWGHLLCCQPLRLILAISAAGFVLASLDVFAKRSITLAARGGAECSIIDPRHHYSTFSLHQPLSVSEGAVAQGQFSGGSHIQLKTLISSWRTKQTLAKLG